MTQVFFKEKGWSYLNELPQDQKAVVLCDSNTRQCLEFLHKACPRAERFPVIEIPAGEQHKNLKTCEMAWYQLTEHGADRNTILLNLGGGVVTDLGGFVASTYMRGIRFVQIPTSLLGMVDAAIGGKTGVDFGGLKNMVGLFSRPEAVIVDSNFLKTLPANQYRNGLAEVLKHAFISDVDLLTLIDGSQDELISRSILVKMEVVNCDEFESGERKKLNFGHTVGHAIESHLLDTEQAILHGEAIAAGMILESFLSNKIAGLAKEELSSIVEVIDSMFSRLELTGSDWNSIKKLMLFDKKNRNGSVRFVLLKSIGHAVTDQAVTEHLLDEAFDFYMSK